MNPIPDQTASILLEVIPLVMRTIRAEMRAHRSDLSVPQFRILLHISRRPGASLAEAAEYLGLTSPTTCKMVDALVGRGLVLRQESTDDRRKVALTLTPQGRTLLNSAVSATLAQIETLLAACTPQQRAALPPALDTLRQAFSTAAEAH